MPIRRITFEKPIFVFKYFSSYKVGHIKITKLPACTQRVHVMAVYLVVKV